MDNKGKLLAEMENQASQPGFWEDNEKARKVVKKMKRLKSDIGPWNNLLGKIQDADGLAELAVEEGDEELLAELEVEAEGFREIFDRLELETLLSDSHDESDAVFSIHAGAGGTEAQDWAEMLLRMYLRWFENNGYEVEEVDRSFGEEAGVKSVTLIVEGPKAYGYLKSERGVHRLVRISPFDQAKRRHTSFAAVEILPEVSDDIEVDIEPDDLKIDTYRSSGAGGQHVNKTSSAVRITHIPTGIVVQCQNERSQFKNKAMAMKVLKSRLYDMMLEQHEERVEQLKGDQKEIAWGSQIRSYVFHPYTMVKDLRTGMETGNIQAVMDGSLDDFIWAYLKKFGGKESAEEK